ncbi:ATP-grasp fold amidoligase family protein [Candidatus Thiosymbion oneisti]|uniref:ATP-grasp fold amidoligase family protein n=1 Tax=Candidatus Thiosymbion oneisti TaxID=589554 RepID=UPI00210E74EA|nr:ATP-grasp fold amidoligase family protein [Candidatus Thiosymbion oneisti]
MKANHGSGMNAIIHRKSELDVERLIDKANSWLTRNYYTEGREYQYRDIPPRLLIEPLLVPTDGNDLVDYKLFCFDGEPRFVQVDFDRHTAHSRNSFTLDWERLPFTLLYPGYPGEAAQLPLLDQMIRAARRLPCLGLPLYASLSLPMRRPDFLW